MQPIPKGLSVYINLVRFVAAAVVVFYHVRLAGFGSPAVNSFLPSFGGACVIVFFVVSGFVIAHAVEAKRSKGPAAFAIDRSIRIYSVAVPVLIICLLLSYFRPDLRPADPALIEPGLTFFLNITFLSEMWNLSYYPYANGPYWSLAYEVVYYVIFGIWSFTSGWRRWILLLLGLIVAGPKILVLFPCWLAGVAVYRYRDAFKVSSQTGAALAVGSLAVLATLFVSGFATKAGLLSRSLAGGYYLSFSSDFLKNWIIAFGFAAHLYGMSQIKLTFPSQVETVSRPLADMSFSLYLLHYPLINLVAAYMDRSANISILLVALVVFPTCYLFSLVTEGQRYRIRSWLNAPKTRAARQFNS